MKEHRTRRGAHARVRAQLVEDLLAGVEPATGAGLAAAHAAGLRAGIGCVLIAAVPTSPVGDAGSLRLAAPRLARAAGGALPSLACVRGGEVVVIRSVDGTAMPDALGDRLARAQAGLARDGIPLAVGVSLLHDGPAELPDAYGEAELAAATLPASGGVRLVAEISAFDHLLARSDPLTTRLISPRVRRFVAADIARGGLLTSTLEAYAEADLSTTVAAERLFVHLNTARYRLRRVTEETGCDLRKLADVLELVIAIRLAKGGCARSARGPAPIRR